MVYVLGCVLVREGNKNRQNFTGTYEQNRPHTEKPGKSSCPLPPEKNFESTPRELQCSDRAQTSTTGPGRRSCVDVLGVLAKSVRTKRYDPKQKKISQIYVYMIGKSSEGRCDVLRVVRCYRGHSNHSHESQVWRVKHRGYMFFWPIVGSD